MALLEVEGIDVFYGPIQALRGVSLRVEQGEQVALLGANGAGKTTTLRTVSGMLSPAVGTITFDGEPIHGMPAFDVVKRGIAHLPEGRELFAPLPVVENLKLGLAPIIVAQLFEILDEINRAGTSILLVEQFVHLALEHTERAYVLQKGEVAIEGPSAKLLADPTLISSYLGEIGDQDGPPDAELITDGKRPSRPRRARTPKKTSAPLGDLPE